MEEVRLRQLEGQMLEDRELAFGNRETQAIQVASGLNLPGLQVESQADRAERCNNLPSPGLPGRRVFAEPCEQVMPHMVLGIKRANDAAHGLRRAGDEE